MNLIDLSEHLTVVSTDTYDQTAVEGEDRTITEQHAAAVELITAKCDEITYTVVHVAGPEALKVLQSSEVEGFVTSTEDDDGIDIEVYKLDGVPVLVNPRSSGVNTVGVDINGNLCTTRIDFVNVTFE